MGFLDSVFKGLQDFAESDTAKRMMERAEQAKADEIRRTTGINGLRCIVDSVDDNGFSVWCRGTVKNIGKSTYSLVVVNVAFKDENKRVVDKKVGYAVSGVTLAPGESMPFEVFSSVKNISSASASIGEYKEC